MKIVARSLSTAHIASEASRLAARITNVLKFSLAKCQTVRLVLVLSVTGNSYVRVCVCVCKNFAELRRGMRIVEAVVLTAVVIVQCNLKSILFKLFDFFSSTILDSHACKSVEYLLKLLSTRRPTNLHCIRDIITRRRNSLFGHVVIDSTTTRQAIAHCHRSPVMLVLVLGLECLVLVLEDQVLVNITG